MYKSLTGILCALLVASGVVAQEVYVDNVVIVLDASGSMNKSMRGTQSRKIKLAKNAIKEVMKTIPQTTQVGLLVFGGAANGWAYPLGPRDDTKLFDAVNRVTADGGTPLGKFMKKGADTLLKARTAQYGYGSYRLLVVTDGEASDESLVDAYTPDIIGRGIVVDVIGVDMAAAHTLARKVHSYRRANDPAALKQAIQEVFAEVGKASDGQTGESAFEELAGLPDDCAMAIISALISSGNQPIGATGRNGDRTHDAGRASQSTQKTSSPKRGGGWNNMIAPGIVIAVIVISILRSGKRRRR